MDNINLNCRLCLRELNHAKQLTISLFKNNLIQRHISSVLFKHLWFLNLENDFYSKVICEECWTTISEFHEFYKQIQNAQNMLFFSRKDQPINSVSYNEETNMKYVKSERASSVDSVSSNNNEPDSDSTSDEFNVDEINKNDDKKYLRKKVKKLKTINSKQKTLDEIAQIENHFNMKCSVCDHLFNVYSDVRTHFREKHKKRGSLTCCGTKFFSRCQMVDHILFHTNPESFKCTICDRSYKNRYLHTEHMKEHDPNIERIQCDMCSQTFRKEFELAHHKRMRHYTEEDKQFVCDVCNKKFLTKRNVKRHMASVHPTKKHVAEMICDICGKEFNSKAYFESHRLDHFNVNRQKLQCNICENWFKTKDSLRVHINRHRTAPVACSYCGKLMNNQWALNSHIKSVHCERDKQCTMCEKAYKSNKLLREHVASHTGHDLYTCTYCTKTFKSNANMHKHRKFAHPLDWERDRGKRITVLKFNTLIDDQNVDSKE